MSFALNAFRLHWVHQAIFCANHCAWSQDNVQDWFLFFYGGASFECPSPSLGHEWSQKLPSTWVWRALLRVLQHYLHKEIHTTSVFEVCCAQKGLLKHIFLWERGGPCTPLWEFARRMWTCKRSEEWWRKVYSVKVATTNTMSCSSLDFLEENQSVSDWQWLATAMLTGVESLKKTYNRDGLQRQAFTKVFWIYIPHPNGHFANTGFQLDQPEGCGGVKDILLKLGPEEHGIHGHRFLEHPANIWQRSSLSFHALLHPATTIRLC